MKKVYFEEIQRMRDNSWMWAVTLGVALAAIIPLGSGVYWQVFRGEPWGDEPMGNNALVLLFLFILFTCLLTVWIILSVKLEVKIDEVGFHYRFVPYKFRWQQIRGEDVESYSIEKELTFVQRGAWGYHRNRLKRLRTMRLKGPKHIRIKLKNGESYVIGTENLEALEWAMKRMMSQIQMS